MTSSKKNKWIFSSLALLLFLNHSLASVNKDASDEWSVSNIESFATGFASALAALFTTEQVKLIVNSDEFVSLKNLRESDDYKDLLNWNKKLDTITKIKTEHEMVDKQLLDIVLQYNARLKDAKENQWYYNQDEINYYQRQLGHAQSEHNTHRQVSYNSNYEQIRASRNEIFKKINPLVTEAEDKLTAKIKAITKTPSFKLKMAFSGAVIIQLGHLTYKYFNSNLEPITNTLPTKDPADETPANDNQ